MMQSLAMSVTICLFVARAASAGQTGSAAGASGHDALQHTVQTITAHLDAARPTPQQLRADAQLLATGYRSLEPSAPRIGSAGDGLMRDLGRRSLDWLARASLLDGRDPAVALALLDGYGSIGDFYRAGRGYPAGAVMAYASAMRLAQRLMLGGGDPARFEREFTRFALLYGTIAAAQGTLLMPWNRPQDLPAGPSPEIAPPTDLEPVPMPPPIDVSQLDAAQKAAYVDARERFRGVAPRVHQARLLLKELSQRLRRQGVALNPEDASNALKMQGFVEEAADLIRTGRFEAASEALTRADYVRAKLRSATGQ